LPDPQVIHAHSDFQAFITITAERINASEGIVEKAHDYLRPGTSGAFLLSEPLLGELKRAYEETSIFYGSKPDFSAVIDRIKARCDQF
jgi:hypothetical protein